MHRSVSLRTYFSIYLGLLMLVMFGVLSLIIGNKSIHEMKIDKGNSLEATAIQMTDKMSSYMWSRSGEIFTLSKLEALGDFDNPSSIQVLLEQLKENFPSFSWIGVTNHKGTVIASTEGILEGVDISQRPVYQEGIKGKFIGDVHDAVLLAKLLPNPSGEPMKFVDVSLPILDANKEPKGVLAAHLSWEWASEIEKSIIDPLKNTNQTEMFVVSSSDHIVLLGPREYIGNTLKLEGIHTVNKTSSHWSIDVWEDGNKYLTGYALDQGYMNYEGLGWTIIVRQPLTKAYSGIREMQVFILFVGLICAVFFSTIIWLIANKISHPIKRISDTAEHIRKGSCTEIPQFYGIKELEMLSVSLRELVGSLVRNESALDQMDTIAHHDFLTGMPNRIGMERYLETATKDHLEENKGLFVICLDLDGFKNINDTYGHHAGDLVLKEVANRLTAMVTTDELAARLGGDEFVVILQENRFKTTKEHLTYMKEIIHEINNPILMEGHSVHVGCSIGASLWNSSLDPHDVLKNADNALYQSKRSGKNRVTLHDESY